MRVPLSGLTEGLLVDAEEVSVGKLKRISGDIAAAYFAGDGGISAEFILRDAVVRHPEMRDACARRLSRALMKSCPVRASGMPMAFAILTICPSQALRSAKKA